jgi:chromosomal replication initiator protein
MKAWEDLLSKMESALTPQAVAQWLRPMQVVRFDAQNIYLQANIFQRSWFEEHVRPHVQTLFVNANTQRPIKIHFENDSPPSEKSYNSFPITSDFLDPLFSIEKFITSDSNQMACRIIQEIVTNGCTTFNPIFISGPSGCGKTHLLAGLARSLQGQGRNIFFVNAETFTSHVVQAIRFGKMNEFRQVYRSVQVLIVDDVHRLARRSATQEEFFHTFNALHTAEIPIILSSCEPSHQLKDIEPRLISRFEWGIPLTLTAPDSAMLYKIILNQAHVLQLNISADLIRYLTTHFTSKITAPIEALHAIAMRCPHIHSIAGIEHALQDLLVREKKSALTAEKILEQTALHFGVRVEDMTGASQQREWTVPRQLAMYLCRHHLKMSLQSIGRLFHRDHSTVISSIKQITKACETNQQDIVDALKTITRATRRGSPSS